MSLQELHLSPEDIRIVRLAGMLVEEEMRFVRKELEKLRSDLALTSAIQRHFDLFSRKALGDAIEPHLQPQGL